MPTSESDRSILRRLAEKQAAIAALPVQKTNIAAWKRLNGLGRGKPLVWINEICWGEFAGDELDLQITDPLLRGVERQFRRTIYQWEHLRGDMVVDPKFYCSLVVGGTGFGVQVKEQTIVQGIGDVRSHHYEPVIKEEADIEKIRMPEVVPDWNATEENCQRLTKLFGDILPVEKRGRTTWWLAPWDQLVTWWGAQEALTDLVLRPELVHHAMDRLTRAYQTMLDQHERLNLLSLNNTNVRVGSGGLGFTDDLPQPDFDPARVRLKDCWGSATPQIFSEVSPAMHWEFALQYELRMLERFGLNCYGCCEPLHRKMSILKKIPNLRRVSMSPRVNIEEGAAALGDKYIFSHKPNPAILATDAWNPGAARAELRSALEKTRGCIVEIILKDISTVRNEPRRLWEWAKVASEVAEEFA